MKTIAINLYEFKELSREIQAEVVKKWYENEDYSMLEDDLLDRCKELLTAAKIEHSDICIYYSLSCSQGDGLCFTGNLMKNGCNLFLSHSARYYYANSVTTILTDADGEELTQEEENAHELKLMYLEICKQLEKEGYQILEYRMTNEEFQEHCEANKYLFEESGEIRNS